MMQMFSCDVLEYLDLVMLDLIRLLGSSLMHVVWTSLDKSHSDVEDPWGPQLGLLRRPEHKAC